MSHTQSKTSHTVAHVLGEMTWLLSQSTRAATTSITDLEWMVMPAILLKQFKIYYDEQQKPVAFATWAQLSDVAEEKVIEAAKAREAIKLTMTEWNSGERRWLIDVLAPFSTDKNQQMDKLLVMLNEELFADRPFRFANVETLQLKKQLLDSDIKDIANA